MSNWLMATGITSYIIYDAQGSYSVCTLIDEEMMQKQKQKIQAVVNYSFADHVLMSKFKTLMISHT